MPGVFAPICDVALVTPLETSGSRFLPVCFRPPITITVMKQKQRVCGIRTPGSGETGREEIPSCLWVSWHSRVPDLHVYMSFALETE